MKITVPWPTITRFCPSREILLVRVKETVVHGVDSPGFSWKELWREYVGCPRIKGYLGGRSWVIF